MTDAARTGRPTASHRTRTGEVLVVATLLVVGLLNLVPGVALVAPSRLETLYAISGLSDTELMLMRHRALMLGLLGFALLAAIPARALRVPALVGGLVSGLVFAVLTWTAPTSDEVARVAIVDVAVLPLLVAALTVCWRSSYQQGSER